MSRYFIFPFVCVTTSWDQALKKFQQESEHVLHLIECLGEKELSTPALVSGLWGIEDSSRYWSVAMTVEHLMIVGQGIASLVIGLSHHQTIPYKVDIAKVKPKGQQSVDSLRADYETFAQNFVTKIREQVQDRYSPVRHDHPWFGPITAHQWLCLAAVHQTIHRKQIEAILQKL